MEQGIGIAWGNGWVSFLCSTIREGEHGVSAKRLVRMGKGMIHTRMGKDGCNDKLGSY